VNPTRAPSLRRRLAAALLGPVLLLSVLGFVYDAIIARRLTDDAYDQAISGVAEGLAMTLEGDKDDDLRLHFASMMRMLSRVDAPDAWRYVVLDGTGRFIEGDPSLSGAARFDTTSNPSFRTAVLRERPERIASYRYEGHNGPATIVVAQTLIRRDAATSNIVGATLWPNVALMSLAIVLMLACVRYALRPLDRLGAHLDSQGVDTLSSFSMHDVPSEVRPLMLAVENLVERLRGAARLQQTFLDHAAHQLRTPLATLQAQIELLPESSPENLARHLGTLHSGVVRLSRVTRQLLMLGRTDRGANTAARTNVDVAELVSSIAAILDDRARARGVHLAFELAPLPVLGIGWMLEEAVSNLVDNAIEHSPADGVVTLRCLGPARDVPGRGCLEIEDEGPGIPEVERQRVFEPFTRLDERRHGTGLGLAIVRSISERHEASVEILAGTGGQGTRVRITFS
jgi:two-component system sensor histidine kinase TctE